MQNRVPHILVGVLSVLIGAARAESSTILERRP